MRDTIFASLPALCCELQLGLEGVQGGLKILLLGGKIPDGLQECVTVLELLCYDT